MKYLLSLALSASPVLLFSQNFVVRADKMNLVYVGMSNPLTIVSGDCGCDALSVSVNKGTIKKVSGCKYEYAATEQGVVTLTVSEQKGGKTQVVGTNTLRAKKMADPQAVVAGRNGGNVPLNQFKAQLGVWVVIPYFEPEVMLKVTRFTFKVLRSGIVMATSDNEGSAFNRECARMMSGLIPGDQVILEHIVCLGPDSVARSLGDVSFTMK